MAKQSFQMLYALEATVRSFTGQTQNTVAITVGYKDAKSGNRVYRGLDHPWVKAIIEAVDDDAITAESLADAEDGFKIELTEPIQLEEGRLINESVPPLRQRFTVNGQEVYRVVRTVDAVLLKSSDLTVEDLVKQKMAFRLTALDENGRHIYGLPSRKSLLLQLAKYFEGNFSDEDDRYDEFTELVNDLDKDDEEEQ